MSAVSCWLSEVWSVTCLYISFLVSEKNWVLTGAIVGFPGPLSSANGLLMVQSGDIISVSARYLCLHAYFFLVLMVK